MAPIPNLDADSCFLAECGGGHGFWLDVWEKEKRWGGGRWVWGMGRLSGIAWVRDCNRFRNMGNSASNPDIDYQSNGVWIYTTKGRGPIYFYQTLNRTEVTLTGNSSL